MRFGGDVRAFQLDQITPRRSRNSAANASLRSNFLAVSPPLTLSLSLSLACTLLWPFMFFTLALNNCSEFYPKGDSHARYTHANVSFTVWGFKRFTTQLEVCFAFLELEFRFQRYVLFVCFFFFFVGTIYLLDL